MSELGDGLQSLAAAWGALQAEAQSYPTPIRIWMGAMATLFFGGVVFTPWWPQARFVVGVMLATLAVLVLGKAMWPAVPRATVGAFAHLALWTPLLAALVWDRVRARTHDRGGMTALGRVYVAWLYLVIAALSVSLTFDARAAFTVLTGSQQAHGEAS